MTTYWVSNPRHFCEVCKVWTGGHIRQIKKHEEGQMHKEKTAFMLKSAREQEKKKRATESDVAKQIAEIERAAQAAMVADGCDWNRPNPPISQEEAELIKAQSLKAAQLEKVAQQNIIQQTVEDAKRRRLEAAVSDAASFPSHAPSTVGAAVAGGGSEAATTMLSSVHWTQHRDPNSGASYWYNATTKESRWTPPPEFAGQATSTCSSSVASSAPSSVGSSVAAASSAAGGATPASGQWTQHRDPNSGTTYYYNATTKESRWTPPPELATEAAHGVGQVLTPIATLRSSDTATASSQPCGPSQSTASVAGSSWVVCTDPNSGHVYYHNRATGTSSWEKPPDLGIDLSKPPPPPSQKKTTTPSSTQHCRRCCARERAFCSWCWTMGGGAA